MALLPSLQADATIDTKGYRRVTARDLVAAKQPPVNTQMLVRDFIDDCLYNPQYGYFSKHATIYSPEQLTDFTALQDSLQFMNHVATKYQDLEGQAEHPTNRLARQVWHTPTELFNPHFGHAIAKYIVTEYKLNHYPEEDLIIYEMGAGNGTLMTNVMDYLQTHEPQVYERTRYNIIEISSQLAEVQANQQSVRSSASAVHRGVQFVNRSIFDWDTEVPHPCFFIAMEVIDNFAHDLIRYDPLSGRAYQGTVLTDRNGDFHEAFEAVADPLIIRYLRLRQQTGYQSPLFHRRAHFWRQLRSHFPFPPNLTEPEFVPTRLLQLMDVLQRYFPRHRLVVSDFFHLPEAVPGIDGPVVQTRYKQTMVPCSTYMVQPGWFDIFFPTNFELMRDMYSQVCRPYAPYSQTKVVGQRVFLERYADLEATTTQSGENPMLDYYENNKFLLT
ncbi:S-adenosyl-L-methionine-dependent methyltransferase [Dimargaris cristalligena]|uniref:Protein arginine methyltransferase NDUFAF7 n=1 Tax=Dimargaris cristalligena TaxID=215637 RepID=A0A4P9ZMV4_9FUNG|nr:S-adenosyl-L-methionine-dependent methyltransferase [Dimargaris cristalligena]|eukprot:RKP33921.1 S-adenosyl-L-methionine-dependent methyltransferase [Dimargaris cristalligena]